MNAKEIQQGFEIINSVTDFIESNTDGDESGIGTEMMQGLYKLKDALNKERKRVDNISFKARVKRRVDKMYKTFEK